MERDHPHLVLRLELVDGVAGGPLGQLDFPLFRGQIGLLEFAHGMGSIDYQHDGEHFVLLNPAPDGQQGFERRAPVAAGDE